MKPGDQATVHQLLGRIVYFHTLFVEPAFTSDSEPGTGECCCNHQGAVGFREPEVGTMLADTAWAVLDEIAITLGEYLLPCPDSDLRCCATCRIVASGAAIAQAWMAAEHRGYNRLPPADRLRQVCGTTTAIRLGRVFARQYGTNCRGLAKAKVTDISPLPDSDDLPLTGELLALWKDPLATTRSPVVSWLNHCTDLPDIHRVLQQGRTTK